MNQDTTLQQEASVREARLRRRQLFRVFDTPDGREALTFLEAINTGHGGSLTTLHAETPQLAVRRLAIAALKTDLPMTYADMVDFTRIAVKCDPDEAIALRERYPEVEPAFHMNKRHWNGIRTTGDLPDSFIREQVRNSYLLVLRRNVTPRALRDELMAYVERTGLPE